MSFIFNKFHGLYSTVTHTPTWQEATDCSFWHFKSLPSALLDLQQNGLLLWSSSHVLRSSPANKQWPLSYGGSVGEAAGKGSSENGIGISSIRFVFVPSRNIFDGGSPSPVSAWGELANVEITARTMGRNFMIQWRVDTIYIKRKRMAAVGNDAKIISKSADQTRRLWCQFWLFHF